MDILTITNFLLIAGVIQGFGFNLVTLFIKKKLGPTVVYLNLVVLALSLNNLQAWLVEHGYISPNFVIQQLEVPWYMFIIPMFHAFTVHYLRIEDKVKTYVKFAVGLFVFEVLIRLTLTSYVYYEVPNQDNYLIQRYTIYEELFNLIFMVFIFIKAINLVFFKHELFKYILTYDDIKWIKIFIFLGVGVIACWVGAVIFNAINNNEEAYYVLRIADSVLLYWIGYQGFYRYNVVQDRIYLRRSIYNEPTLNGEFKVKNIFNSSEKNEVNEKHQKDFNRIKNHILEEKLYLDPLLNMEQLASDMNMSKSYFSKLINTYSAYNFSDFVNSLRVEQAKQLLCNDEFDQYTIVAIGLECGFNSKSTFYSSFKKFTSQTPTEFKAQIA
ncbi:helix-turn-helix domain-containing protein [Aegicerativicinus sediminis]|uniref:helix-turn-helix domain-containing protein n=1 Tax=Aegicerativicinus sediminis TaxID=2893202 RepID=UPI001E330DC1|nr:AraC family transcriptional regulator [Aegicerativicinus sediminis]